MQQGGWGVGRTSPRPLELSGEPSKRLKEPLRKLGCQRSVATEHHSGFSHLLQLLLLYNTACLNQNQGNKCVQVSCHQLLVVLASVGNVYKSMPTDGTGATQGVNCLVL